MPSAVCGRSTRKPYQCQSCLAVLDIHICYAPVSCPCVLMPCPDLVLEQSSKTASDVHERRVKDSDAAKARAEADVKVLRTELEAATAELAATAAELADARATAKTLRAEERAAMKLSAANARRAAEAENSLKT